MVGAEVQMFLLVPLVPLGSAEPLRKEEHFSPLHLFSCLPAKPPLPQGWSQGSRWIAQPLLAPHFAQWQGVGSPGEAVGRGELVQISPTEAIKPVFGVPDLLCEVPVLVF